MSRYSYFVAAIAIALIATPAALRAQGTMSDSDYMAKVMASAPSGVVKGATVVQINKDGSMRTLQKGSNGFTCLMIDQGTAGCGDQNAMAWMKAIMSHSAPPSSVGFMYMLGGDAGASNTDPYSMTKTDSNHWVVTGPHVMILGPSIKMMGYPMTADADPTKPYVMWPDTQYAHLMIPVSVQP